MSAVLHKALLGFFTDLITKPTTTSLFDMQIISGVDHVNQTCWCWRTITHIWKLSKAWESRYMFQNHFFHRKALSNEQELLEMHIKYCSLGLHFLEGKTCVTPVYKTQHLSFFILAWIWVCIWNCNSSQKLTGWGAKAWYGKWKAAGYGSMPHKPQATPLNPVFPTKSAMSKPPPSTESPRWAAHSHQHRNLQLSTLFCSNTLLQQQQQQHLVGSMKVI